MSKTDQLPATQASNPRRLTLEDVHMEEGLEPPDGKAISSDEKQAMAARGDAFELTGVELAQSDKFTSASNPDGNYWELQVNTMTGPRLLFMSWKESTEARYRAYERHTDAGAIIGPLRLELVEWSGGNPFYTLRSADVETIAPTRNAAELPF